MAQPTHAVRLGVDSELEPRCVPAAKLVLDTSGVNNFSDILNVGDVTSVAARINVYWANDSASGRLFVGYDDVKPLKPSFTNQELDSTVNGADDRFSTTHGTVDHPSTRYDDSFTRNLPDDAFYDALLQRQVVYRLCQLVSNGGVTTEHGDWISTVVEHPTNTATSALRPQPEGTDLSSVSMTTDAVRPC